MHDYGSTPLLHLEKISRQSKVVLFIKHDDLYPFVGGGNKARKIGYFLSAAKGKGANVLITTGGLQSNHARVTALVAAEMGWRCVLVLHGSLGAAEKPKGNLLLMRLAGAEVRIVRPEKIQEEIEKAEQECKGKGLNPYVIPGGGHAIEGSCAYFDAVEEIKGGYGDSKTYPDWIVLASGTGTTQAGIVAGLQAAGAEVKVIGVSVARKNPRGRTAVVEAYKQICHNKGMHAEEERIDFRDNWVGEGYEQADGRVLETITSVCQKEGLVLDPTYTGKAFLGLLDMIETGEIAKGASVVFWHTGGLLNLLSSEEYLERMLKS